jgi:hypothetical protein
VLDTILCDKVCKWPEEGNIVESGVKH